MDQVQSSESKRLADVAEKVLQLLSEEGIQVAEINPVMNAVGKLINGKIDTTDISSVLQLHKDAKEEK